MGASPSSYVTVGAAAARAGIPEATLRRWIAAGALPATLDAGEDLVRLEDVRRLIARDALAARAGATRAERPRVVTGALVEPTRYLPPAAPAAPARPEGLALVGALVGAMITKLDGVYSATLTAKDDQLAAKDDLIVELRRRIERTERDLASREQAPAVDFGLSPEDIARLRDTNARQARELRSLRAQLAALETARRPLARPHTPRDAPAGATDEERTTAGPAATRPTPAPTAPPVPSAARRAPTAESALSPSEQDGVLSRPRRAGVPWAPWRPVLLAGLVGIVVAVVLLPHITGAPTPAAIHPERSAGRPLRTHVTTGSAVIPLAGVPLVARQALGDTVGLLAPRAAVALPTGDIAVLDTGNRRVALLDSAGRLVRSEQGAGLRDPVAMVVASNALYVLDAGRGAVERYDLGGRFVREVVRDGALRSASGMALGRRGLLYVANPHLDRIVVVGSVDGVMRRPIAGNGGRAGFTRPVAVAVGRSALYVLDGVDGHIVALNSSGRIAARWPPIASPEINSGTAAHVIAWPDGRLLVSGPGGAILVYADTTSPIFRRDIGLPGGRGRPRGPLGISRTPGGALLVADTAGNQVLLLPGLR